MRAGECWDRFASAAQDRSTIQAEAAHHHSGTLRRILHVMRLSPRGGRAIAEKRWHGGADTKMNLASSGLRKTAKAARLSPATDIRAESVMASALSVLPFLAPWRVVAAFAAKAGTVRRLARSDLLRRA